MDLVRIRWPSGIIQEFTDVVPNQRYVAHESAGLVLVPDPPTLWGDADNDGLVSGLDLISVMQNFGTTDPGDPSGLLPGDANSDGLVSGADLITVQQNFGDAMTATAPEPTALVLFGIYACLFLSRRKVRLNPSPRE